MDDKDRDKINKNIDQLVNSVDMKTLLPKLFRHNIYSEHYPETSEWMNNLDDPEVKKKILLEITKRGPNAYETLIKSLEETNQHLCVEILRNDSVEPNSIQTDQLIQVKKSTRFYDQNSNKNKTDTYRMRSNPRGLVLIISLIDYKNEGHFRHAADDDEKSLKNLFEQMGFKVYIERNLTAQKIREKTNEFSQKSELQHVDSAFIIVCGHGNMNLLGNDSVIYGTDYDDFNNQVVSCNDIINYFVSEKCKYLKNKPKIFIFQMCRGLNHQIAINNDMNRNPPLRFIFAIGNSNFDYSDMLVAHSTLPDCVAYRDSIAGSWFIQTCCEVFANYACEHHVEDLFTIISEKMGSMKTKQGELSNLTCQTPTARTHYFKNCFINPGLSEDDS